MYDFLPPYDIEPQWQGSPKYDTVMAICKERITLASEILAMDLIDRSVNIDHGHLALAIYLFVKAAEEYLFVAKQSKEKIEKCKKCRNATGIFFALCKDPLTERGSTPVTFALKSKNTIPQEVLDSLTVSARKIITAKQREAIEMVRTAPMSAVKQLVKVGTAYLHVDIALSIRMFDTLKIGSKIWVHGKKMTVVQITNQRNCKRVVAKDANGHLDRVQHSVLQYNDGSQRKVFHRTCVDKRTCKVTSNKKRETWHFEFINDTGHAVGLCRGKDTYGPSGMLTTANAEYVTCKRCLRLLEKQQNGESNVER